MAADPIPVDLRSHSPSRLVLIALSALTLTLASPVFAQRGGGGGGGGGGFFGGRGGGEDFRTRMLQRLDANGNGIVEPNEVPEQARGMVERFAQGAGLAPGQPIPINGSASIPSDTANKPEAGKKSADDLYPRIPKFGDPGVHGFGVGPDTLNGKVIDLEKKYDRRILESVNRTLERYDKNKTGLLEHDEWVTVSWRSDPRESDLDKDGLLTKAELAERYRKGLIDEEESDNRGRGGPRGGGGDRRGGNGEGGLGGGFPWGGRGGGDGGGGGRRGWGGGGWGGGGGPGWGGGGPGWGGGGGPGGGGPGGDEDGSGGRRRGRGGFDPTAMLTNLDRNGNGQIEPDEVDERMKGFASQMGLNLDKPMPIDEIVKTISAGRRNRGNENGGGDEPEKDKAAEKKKPAEPPPPANGYRVAGPEKHQGRKSFRNGKATLPKILPDWWEERDQDKDGQIGLDEFSTKLNDTAMKEFNKFDRNRDGLITAEEAGAIAAKGTK